MTEEEMNLIEALCKPLIELLKKHPYHSITINDEHIEVNNTVMRIPLPEKPYEEWDRISKERRNGGSDTQ